MRTLITNDDGVDSRGLSVLATVANTSSLDDIHVAAPHTECSGSSASLYGREEYGRLSISPRELPGLPELGVRAVEASPALIAFVAAHGAFGPPPTVVLSGINHGPNTGRAILHSGTVGAALTAAAHGALAMAVSLAAADPHHWDTAEAVTARALDWLLAHGTPGTVLNINIPDLPLSQLRGLRAASLAASGAVQADIGETGDDFVTISYSEVEPDQSVDTDAGLLARGWATATVLRGPCPADDVDLAAFPTAL
ncbi:MAG: 5'/3'-nucleotidase SurE [Rhodococcus sp.]|nr:5'/3'-nucleotidase SurE [Rhodococcus sp. (in: high G+C Gram-positive bacteria)]